MADIQLALDAQGVHDCLSEIWPEALGAWVIDVVVHASRS